MSNADFYNNIKKQAASMESSYPDLSQHIKSQSQQDKKLSREKPKGLTIQMGPKETTKKPLINPSMIIERSQSQNNTKISINKERPPSATISSSSIVSTNAENTKNQNNSTSNLKFKLNPSLIKVRSKSSDISQVQTGKGEKVQQELPPGFEKPKNENEEKNQKRPEDSKKQKCQPNQEMPPGFEKPINENIEKSKKQPENAQEKESQLNQEIPPGFKKARNENQENNHKQPENKKEEKYQPNQEMPPGFEKPINENKENDKKQVEDVREKESRINQEIPPGFEKLENDENNQKQPEDVCQKESQINQEIPPEFEKPKNESEENNQKQPEDMIEINRQLNQEIPPGFEKPKNEIQVKMQPEDAREKESQLNQGILLPQKSEKITDGFPTQSFKLSADKICYKKKVTNQTNDDIQKAEIHENKDQNDDNKISKGNKAEYKEDTKSNDVVDIEVVINVENKKSDEVVTNHKDDLNIAEKNDIDSQSPEKIEAQDLSHNNQNSEQAKIDFLIESQDKNAIHQNNSKPHQDEQESIHGKQSESHNFGIDEIHESEPESYIKPKIDVDDIENHESKFSDIPEQKRREYDLDELFPLNDDDDFFSDSRFGYEEEEEEEAEINAEIMEEEEEIERNVLLPSQLVAQPLEIEKRSPIVTNIKIETIDTINPFASYEDIENQINQENESNSDKTKFINYDSSRFPTSYGINEHMAYAFNNESGRINVFELITLKPIFVKQNNLTAITAKGNFIVATGNEEIHYFKIGKKISRSHTKFDFYDVTSFVADPLDRNRFFYYIEKQHKLYILLTCDVKNKKKLIADNVLSFDVCSKYLLIASSINNGVIRCITRKDGSLFDLWQRPVQVNSEFSCCITDDYYIEKIGGNVSIFDAENLKKVQSLTHVVHIFKGGRIPLFLLTNGSLIHFRQIYRFPRPVICAVANKNSVVAWHSLDEAPYASKTPVQAVKQETYNKHQLKLIHSTITKKTREYLKEFPQRLTQKNELFKAIDNAFTTSNQAIDKFNESLGEMTEMVKSMTPKSSLLDSCLDDIEKRKYDEGFANSLMLENADFVQFLADKRIDMIFDSIKSLNDNNENDNSNSEKIALSDDLLQKLITQIIENTEIGSIWLVDRLVHLLLSLPEEKRKGALWSKKEKVQKIIQEYGSGIKEENTLKNFNTLNQIFSSSAE